MLIPIIILGVAFLLLGFEMFLVLGVPTLLVKETIFGHIPDMVVVQKLVGGIDHTTLLAIPFFILAAHIMGSGAIAKHLIGFVRVLIGHTRGGIGHTVVGASMAFGSVSGSAPATVAAMGGMMYPELRKVGFSEKFSLGLIVSSAETALLIPPSITFIIYGWMTGTSIAKLFAGGLAVGLFLGLAFSLYVYWEAKRNNIEGTPKIPFAEKMALIRSAGWALGMPVIILGGIYSGVFTPTEAAAVSVVYAVIVECLVYRKIGMTELFRIIENSVIATAIIFILLAFGGLLSFFVTLAQLPTIISNFLTAVDAGPIMFLIIVNICFLIAGMFIDPNSTQLILVPPLFPVAMALGIDPVHFGMIVTLNVSLGMITPPFGLDIFVGSSTLNKPVVTIIKGVWPFVAINLLVLLVITYVPSISLFFPNLIFG